MILPRRLASSSAKIGADSALILPAWLATRHSAAAVEELLRATCRSCGPDPLAR